MELEEGIPRNSMRHGSATTVGKRDQKYGERVEYFVRNNWERACNLLIRKFYQITSITFLYVVKFTNVPFRECNFHLLTEINTNYGTENKFGCFFECKGPL